MWQKEKLHVLCNFFFCHYVFKKPSAAEASESVYMRERVNYILKLILLQQGVITFRVTSVVPAADYFVLHATDGRLFLVKSLTEDNLNNVNQYTVCIVMTFLARLFEEYEELLQSLVRRCHRCNFV